MMTKIEFGEWVKRERNSLGLSLRELSKKVQISHSQISNIENGTRPANIDFCDKFAKLIGANLEDVEKYAGLRPANYIPFQPQSVSPLAIKIADMINKLPANDQELILKITELVVSGHGARGSPPAKQKAGTQP